MTKTSVDLPIFLLIHSASGCAAALFKHYFLVGKREDLKKVPALFIQWSDTCPLLTSPVHTGYSRICEPSDKRLQLIVTLEINTEFACDACVPLFWRALAQ